MMGLCIALQDGISIDSILKQLNLNAEEGRVSSSITSPNTRRYNTCILLLVSEVGRADTHPSILVEEKRRPDLTPTLTLPYTLFPFEDCSLTGNSIHLTYQSC
jgi:hypothetical protein